MLKPEILEYITENQLYEHCCFVTDDTMADALLEKGQLNYIVRKAVEMGFPLTQAIYCASYTPARRMNLRDRGTLAPGRKADFQLVKETELHRFEPKAVFKDGKEIFWKGKARHTLNAYHFRRNSTTPYIWTRSRPRIWNLWSPPIRSKYRSA